MICSSLWRFEKSIETLVPCQLVRELDSKLEKYVLENGPKMAFLLTKNA